MFQRLSRKGSSVEDSTLSTNLSAVVSVVLVQVQMGRFANRDALTRLYMVTFRHYFNKRKLDNTFHDFVAMSTLSISWNFCVYWPPARALRALVVYWP